jgi:isoprenylcysteine carboxyl methyltransferase (ICMT) family protein YpbQ
MAERQEGAGELGRRASTFMRWLWGTVAVGFLVEAIIEDWPRVTAWASFHAFVFIFHLLVGALFSYMALTGRMVRARSR